MNQSYLEKIPIRDINLSNPIDKMCYTNLVMSVGRITNLKAQAIAKSGHEKTSLQRQIEATDRRIDRLVYELYGLTEEEIRIVEEGTQ